MNNTTIIQVLDPNTTGTLIRDGEEIGEIQFDFYSEETDEWERLADKTLEESGWRRIAPWTDEGTKVVEA